MSKDIELNPPEVEFLEKLKESKYSVVFKVRFRERTCVMKVQIDLSNYSPKRLAKFPEILNDIHAAGVLHADPKPRNMMVSLSEDDRVLWIDFDSAQTFPEGGDLSPRQLKWVEGEDEMVDYFVDALPKDFEEGKLNRTISYYYEWYV
ncbi:hypothetical protein AnigIFM56816_005833 [Aspergillus niger]|nr:hypothetical protein AnigIFM56816_005833 [Aspergillus niger]